ncbi:glutamate--tRNA ligase [Carboxydothermus hydrogenoformans]|uniref:Glutamate--tRNA ligase n=1 Tax=Carboxydothermus hydrogenoformans (strain ATCC BAA-161 / DSM 6008 / Z-2901) TaxID=246194 RepID=SYE_CARHZ|nr:glutamate--tRNA ligase [Carboxydothermus hydrogenoformans]Q3A9N9.1 RecName: Full=Glutamate--tRNA ligase; AltName: Full=Glutamyl-tRNA synthetase; Short=GluRS [Carboxydothermus hydrogenoformans Z-2901]ABB13998.1 glutamyl-tRNA synthetase [Carboxydothermus hydrogenoformans Z-2901]
MVRVRFAPSPTGPLHIGGARSALFNYLFARKNNGVFIVRIEDTDLERSSRESEKNILESLKWLGITWDEGIEVGGENGPYRQTERLDLYQKYAQKLIEEGFAYYCFCTEEELEEERKNLLAKGEMPRYLGKCRNLTPEQKEKYLAEGRKPTVRFKVPAGRTIVINDLVRGVVSFETDGIGDFIIVKSDGIPTYNFAVVIDDVTMGITHVLRGEEHLSNTPRQILIYEALGFKIPEFAHISLILGKDRTKMSKRHGATSVENYREKGYLPEALVNFLALLGWSPGTEEEIFTMEQLIERFSLDRVAKNPAIFDLDKLNWINGYYIRNSELSRIVELSLPFFQSCGYVSQNPTEEEMRKLTKVVEATREYVVTLSELPEHAAIFYQKELAFEEEAKTLLADEEARNILRKVADKLREIPGSEEEEIKGFLKKLPKELGVGGKKVYMPLRAALTGKTHGPELYQVIAILGPAEAERRIMNLFN